MMSTKSALFMFSIILRFNVESQSVPTCIKSNNPVHAYNVNNLINDGWTECYSASYETYFEISTLITNCPMGDDIYLFIGAMETETSLTAYVGAFAPSSVISMITDSTTKATIPHLLLGTDYDIYWYNYKVNYYVKSLGFSPTADISLTAPWGGDEYDISSNDRLSWAYERGYRAGTNIDLHINGDIWHKNIYYKQCSTPLVPATHTDSSCIMSNNIVNNWHINTYLTNNGWRRCYDESYETITLINTVIDQCPMGDDYYVFMAVVPNFASTFIYLGAFAPSSVISSYTTSTTNAKIPDALENTEYSVYWYNHYLNSFGFAPIKDISLTFSAGGDQQDIDSDGSRVSWSNKGYGGYRTGIYSGLTTDYNWRKLLFYKQCTNTLTVQPQTLDGFCVMNNIVHGWNINANLINQGWNMCYLKEYWKSTDDVSKKGCPTGSNYYIFVGALPHLESAEIYLGAYAPSNVLSTKTTSTTTAYIPDKYSNSSNSEYNVYWYNIVGNSFGFSPTQDISLTVPSGGDEEHKTESNGGYTATERISWSQKADYAGYRVGKYVGLTYEGIANSMWYKVIYYKQCLPPTLDPTEHPTLSPTFPTNSPSNAPTLPPSNSPTFSPTIPTLTPTVDPTMQPTMPTVTPTIGERLKVCNFTGVGDCVLNVHDSEFCCYTVGAVNMYTSDDKRDEGNRVDLTQEQILSAIMLIKDLSISMFVMDTLLVIMACCMWCGLYVNEETDKLKYVKLITVCATFIDIILTLISIGIITGNDLIQEISNLYQHNCYSDETIEDILGLKEQLNQVLILDGLEAGLDVIGLIVLCIGMFGECDKCRIWADSIHGVLFGLDVIGLIVLCIGMFGECDKCRIWADSIHGVLFGLDWILVVVNFFAFVLPSYNKFVSIYDNVDLLCYQGIYVTY
eukprot:510705_1